MNVIDRFLDHITMYRLLLYYLLALVGAAIVLAAIGDIALSPVAIAASAGFLSLFCWVVNKVFAWVWRVPTNFESSLITALILALIITPPASVHDYIFPAAAGGLAMASKYILTIRRQHIFNPAAIAVVLTSFGAGQSASWWVGSLTMLPFVVVGGLLLVRKIQRVQMVSVFIGVTLLATIVYNLAAHTNAFTALSQTFLHSSLFFLAFIMLTEPLTSPVRLTRQRWYGALAGLLFPPEVHLAGLYTTPELVLVVSNVFAYFISPRVRLVPRLAQKIRLAPDIVDFVFRPDAPVRYLPGQYMEWTLPHAGMDSRGTRRYFTLASSPTEPDLRLGVKFYPEGSSFKRALLAADTDTPIAAGHLGGDFVLPSDRTQKLTFIAGGIGITPFRSMVKFLTDSAERRTITLLYSERSAQEVVYREVFDAAAPFIDLRTVYMLTEPGTPIPPWACAGFVTATTIVETIPDFRERWFYVSGPQTMVVAMRSLLQDLEVPSHQIKTDFFPGYA